MEPVLPNQVFAAFRAVGHVKRGDIVLVDHPDAGMVVRAVSAVGRSGRVALRAFSRSSTGDSSLAMVDPARVKGRLMFRIRGSGFLPAFGKRVKAFPLEGRKER